MNRNIFARLTGTQRSLVALLASGAMLTAGCANMATAPSNVGSLNPNAAISGKVHGGNQPVSGATVNLYFASQANGVAAQLVASTTTASDGSGSFNFSASPTAPNDGSTSTFHCPSGVGSPLVYVVAKGGNTLNNGNSSDNNSAAAFIAVYGLCSDLTNGSFVDMTELTTVATMAAVQQFFNPVTDSIAADGTGQQYNVMINIPKTIALLADLSTGTGVSSTVIPAGSGNGVTGVSVTATPEGSKLNTIANAISSCVNNANSSATACTTLFANATPPSPSVTNPFNATSFPPATDVIQATYYMLTNPTDIGSTNGLQNIYSLGTGLGAPYQPTLPTAPTDWTVSINYSSISTCGTNGGGFINSPYGVSIDAQDNVWIANSQATKGNLSELSLTGAPATCSFIGGSSNGGSTVDSAGNVWMASTESNNIFRYSNGTVTAFPTPTTPLAVAADGLGNVYFTSGLNQSLYQIPGAATSATAVAPVQISNQVGTHPIRIMPDYQGNTTQSNLWVSSGAGFVSRVSPATSGPNLLNGFSTTNFSTGGSVSYGLVVTNGGDVVASADNFLVYLSKANSYAAAWTTSANFAGMNSPTGISLDGANNIWVPNNTNASGSLGSVSEVSAVGGALSPASTGFQKATLLSGRASVVDQAGNVWIVGDGANSITEIVGGGVPIYQPYSKGLSNGRFQTIP